MVDSSVLIKRSMTIQIAMNDLTSTTTYSVAVVPRPALFSATLRAEG